MNIILKNSEMVRPAEKTPHKIVWLSRLDIIPRTPYSHSRFLFIYDNTSNADKIVNFLDAGILKESLSRVLVPFYPLAGRLKMNDNNNGRYEIDCNGEGVLFVEAETTLTLDEIEKNGDLGSLMAPQCDYSKGIGSFPLVMTLLTRFKCGGVCLGFFTHRHAIDGASSAQFLNAWARLARGLDIGVMPVHDHHLAFLAARDLPQIKFQHLEFQPPLPPLRPVDLSGKVCDAIEHRFELSKDEIDALKLQAQVCKDTPNEYKLSTFEIVAGHVWRCATRARGLADDQDVKLHMPVNARSRLSLPQGYCGNATFHPNCSARAKDIVHNSLGHAAGIVHEMLKNMKDPEYMRSAIDCIESQPDLGPDFHIANTVTCPNLYINSWASINFGDADFGWGNPTFVGSGGVKCEGQAFLLRTKHGDGSLLLAIKLYSPHMPLFEKYLRSI